MNNIIDIQSYEPQESDCFLLDCNVLFYINYPNGDYRRDLITIYSNFFSAALSKKSKFYITDIMLSEFINTYIQIEFKKYCENHEMKKNKNKFKKIFRQSDHYQEILNDISIILNTDIFSTHKKLNLNFSDIPLDNLFSNPNNFDFNDIYYCKIANKYNIKIITHDVDFKENNETTILTANRRLLS
ncbi:MAG: PIN domain-containing protein [Clostridiales bacterium]|nr:PIN domain-containing protein [Clostridiales bacterium]